MEACAIYSAPIVNTEQAEAMFMLLFSDKIEVDVSTKIKTSILKVSQQHATFALWLTYKTIVTNHNPSDKQIIYFLKSKFDIKSDVTGKCLKALDSVFEAINIFSYHKDQNCKRYNTGNKDQALISAWCLSYSATNEETQFINSRLKIKY